jgi:hypothetical protein
VQMVQQGVDKKLLTEDVQQHLAKCLRGEETRVTSTLYISNIHYLPNQKNISLLSLISSSSTPEVP